MAEADVPGSPPGTQETLDDKAARASAQELRRAYRLLIGADEARWERNLTTPETWYSPAFFHILGLPEDASRDDITECIHPDDRDGVKALCCGDLDDISAFNCEIRYRHRDGDYRWAQARGRVWHGSDGRAGHMIGTLSDIHEQKLARIELEEHRHRLQELVAERTERLAAALADAERQREQAEQANEAKSVFLAHMSHEIRTPLNGVLGLNELALNEAQTDQQRRYLTLALHSGRALLGIINDVLDFSRLSAGAVAIKSENFDLGETLAEPMRSIMPMVRDKGLTLMFDYVGHVTRVTGDRQRLQQIVTNLLANAAKYTEHGHIELFAEVLSRADGEINAHIVVSDSGPGMAAEVAARVFEPFVQGDERLARRHGGTGLGLSIARTLARSLGGDLNLSTLPGQGSTFTLDIPLKVQPVEQPAGLRPPPGQVWLVFSQRVSAERLARRMERLGWHSLVLDGVPGLVQVLEAGSAPLPDLVVLAETSLTEGVPLAELRALMPHTEIILLVQPDWNQPSVEADARATHMKIVVRPLTPTALVELLSPHKSGPPDPDSGFVELTHLPDPGSDILVAEDNLVNQIIITEMIESLGLRARLVEDGAAALQACQERAPSMVLMDLQMPGVDGLEATRLLRRSQDNGELPEFPIIALTAHATPQDRERALNAGMVGYLTKPMSLSALRNELARWLVR